MSVRYYNLHHNNRMYDQNCSNAPAKNLSLFLGQFFFIALPPDLQERLHEIILYLVSKNIAYSGRPFWILEVKNRDILLFVLSSLISDIRNTCLFSLFFLLNSYQIPVICSYLFNTKIGRMKRQVFFILTM